MTKFETNITLEMLLLIFKLESENRICRKINSLKQHIKTNITHQILQNWYIIFSIPIFLCLKPIYGIHTCVQINPIEKSVFTYYIICKKDRYWLFVQINKINTDKYINNLCINTNTSSEEFSIHEPALRSLSLWFVLSCTLSWW